METALVVLTVLVSILLIIVVLIQKSKGGGLASNFAGSNQIMGVRRTNDFIQKTTWTLAIIILALSILSSVIKSNSNAKDANRFDIPNAQTEQTQTANFGTEAPVLPSAADNAMTQEPVAAQPEAQQEAGE